MASQRIPAAAQFDCLQPAVVSFQPVWPCFPVQLPLTPFPRPQYTAWDYTGLAEPSWGSYTSFNPESNQKKSRKFFLDRSVFDLVDAHPYLSLTDPKLLGWYLGLTPEDRNIILDQGGFHQFLQRHPALEVSNHHVFVKYPDVQISPVLPTLTSMSHNSKTSGSKKCIHDLPCTHLEVEMCSSNVRDNLNLQQHEVICHCKQLVDLQDNFHKACSSSHITQEPSHQCVFTERLLQVNEEKHTWQMSSSVAVCKDPAALSNLSLDMELERSGQRGNPEPRSHIFVEQKANITANLAEVSPLPSERSNNKESSFEYFDSTEVNVRNIVQSVKSQQVKGPLGSSEEKEGCCQDLKVCGKEESVDENKAGTDEDDNFQSILEHDVKTLVSPDSKGMKKHPTDMSSAPVTTKTEEEVEASESMKPATVRRASEMGVSTCDAMVGSPLPSFTTAFTQSESPETADKNILTELYMSDLDEIAEEFIKIKKALEAQRKKKRSTGNVLRKQCDCIQRAQRAELHLLALQYTMCTQHCWRLYYVSAEGGLTFMHGDPTNHCLREFPANFVAVLEKLEADYNRMRHKILKGIPLQQLKPLCVDSQKISSGENYTPAQMIGDVAGNLPSWHPLKPQEKKSSEDHGCLSDGRSAGCLDSQTQGKKTKEERMKSKRAVTLIPQDRSANQGSACNELNTSEVWFDAVEVMDHVGPAEMQPDPTVIPKDGTTESAVEEVSNSDSLLYVTNIPSHVTESDVMLWFEKYGASEVNISVLNGDLRVATVMISDGLQSAEAAEREMNRFSVDGHSLHVKLISGAGAAVAAPKSSQEDNTRPQPLKTGSRGSDRELTLPLPVGSSIRGGTVISFTPTGKGTFVPQHFGTMGSLDFLMSELKRCHPHMEKQRFIDALVKLRTKHRGVLCGVPLSIIREMTSELLTRSETDSQI